MTYHRQFEDDDSILKALTTFGFIVVVLGLPLSYLFLTYWMNSFAYRKGMGVWIFLLWGGGIIALGIMTVVIQSIRTARRNPVVSLRYE